MFKKLFLAFIFLAVFLAWLGGIFSLSINPFSLNIKAPEKDFLKRVAAKAKNIVYREATKHNPPGDMLPDQIDDSMKGELKKIIN